ncbi:MAG: O-antigen ligase family protein [Lachnospiraceae bacterium]|nr:O-antigen ligase family protein [Lachnospiraceae bacterium]
MENSKKNLKTYNKYMSGIRICDWMLFLYLVAVLGVFPWFLHDAYFDITITKYKFIITATFSYIILFVMAYVIETLICYALTNNFKDTYINSVEVKKSWKRPGFWAVAFMLANIFAYIVSVDQTSSMTGSKGRYMGCMMYVLMCIMFLMVSSRAFLNAVLLIIFGCATFFSYFVAIMQHAGNDFMGYKEGISHKSYYIFTSTFGNINIFASFISISLPIFLALYIFSKKLIWKIPSAILVISGGMCLIISNSDSVYLGVGAAFILLFFISYYNGQFTSFVEAVFMMAIGNLLVVIMRMTVECEYDKNRGGVAEVIDKPSVAVAMVVMIVLVYVAVLIGKKKLGDKLELLNKKKVILTMSIIMVVAFVLVIVYGNIKKISLFTFDYEWGTYRGYIWIKCMELFEEAPLTNKLFGYGNETLKMLTTTNFYEEMIDVTGKTYDNAHNEVLQYLVTTGLVGALSYIGMFLSSVVYIIKNAKKNAIAYACGASIVGYFVQGLINVNQPITTPYFFVIMAMGVGYVRYMKKAES